LEQARNGVLAEEQNPESQDSASHAIFIGPQNGGTWRGREGIDQ
jgi:hypothetical protein